MSEKNMPVAEAGEVELSRYELAFHVLPTVAEGEVAAVFQKLKDTITKAGGTLGEEEAPARFDLAYEIVTYLEGRNRKFTSAYFGWVRFSLAPAEVTQIEEVIKTTPELLRHILVKLTKIEEENPFFFHEALEQEQVQTIDVDEEKKPEPEKTEEDPEKAKDGEESKDEV